MLIPVGRESTASQGPTPEAREIAHGAIELEYGTIIESYGEDSLTLKEWKKAEPENTSGLTVSPSTEDDPAFAEFIRGNFEVSTHLGDSKHTVKYKSGRVVYDTGGLLLSVQFWEKEKKASPAFGSSFDDDTMGEEE